MEDFNEKVNPPKKSIFGFKFLILCIILLSVFGFLIQNNQEINVKALFWEIEVSIVLLLFIYFMAGLLTSFFLLGPLFSSSVKKNKQIEVLNKKISELELKLKNEKI